MKWSEYRRKTEEELKGRKVRTNVEMSNGWGTIPARTVAKITRKFKGFSLRTEPCPNCGLSATISRVNPSHIELLPKDVQQ